MNEPGESEALHRVMGIITCGLSMAIAFGIYLLLGNC